MQQRILYTFLLFTLNAGLPFNGHANTLEEITVYSTLDDGLLSNLTASVSILDESDFFSRNAQHLDQLALSVPNLSFSGGASRGRFAQIRGIGDIEQFVDPKAYPSVGLVVDGIELNGLFGAGLLFDAKQVEVLRGPQGTRFGASALAGAIHIVSNDANANKNYIESGYGRFDSRQLGGAFGGNISDNVSARISAQQYRSDGYIENKFLDRDNTGDFDEFLVRSKISWQVNDDQDLDFVFLLIDNDNGYDAFSLENTEQTTFSNEPGFDKQRVSAVGVTHRFELNNNSQIKSNISYLKAKTAYGFDQDWKDPTYCAINSCPFGDFNSFDSFFRDREDLTLDIRFINNSFIAGLYFQEIDTKLDRLATDDGFIDFDSDYNTKRKALYFAWSPQLSPSLKAHIGARGERFDDDYSDVNSISLESDDDLWSAEASLTFDINHEHQLYGLISRGNKAGGVNTDASSNIESRDTTGPLTEAQAALIDRQRFSSESLTNVEIGLKSNIQSLGLTSSINLFYNKRNNPQFETFIFDPTTFAFIGYLDNADSAESSGLEWELSAQLNQRLTLNASAAYIDSSIKNYRAQDFEALDSFTFVFQDINEQDQPRAAKYQYSLSGEVTINDRLKAVLQVEGRDDFGFAYYFNERSENVNLFHANIEYALDNISFNIWARNILDKSYATQGLFFGNDPADSFVTELYTQLGEPRNFGLTARYSFSD